MLILYTNKKCNICGEAWLLASDGSRVTNEAEEEMFQEIVDHVVHEHPKQTPDYRILL